MERAIDLTQQKFGKLTVIGRDDSQEKSRNRAYWLCQCECGNITSVRSDSLRSGAIRSCGCLKKAQDKINLAKSGKRTIENRRLYDCWVDMKRRCYNIHNKRYHRYGGRGITVCDEWKNSFASFYAWSLNNGYTDELTLDRIDNDKSYAPDNCRWATRKEQSTNRSTNIKLTIGNATKTLSEWCEIFEVDYKKVNRRYKINQNRTVEELFN